MEWDFTAPSTSATNELGSDLTGSGMKLNVRDRGNGLGVTSTSVLIGKVLPSGTVTGCSDAPSESLDGMKGCTGESGSSQIESPVVMSDAEGSVAANNGTLTCWRAGNVFRCERGFEMNAKP
jgi:hypothetical protein